MANAFGQITVDEVLIMSVDSDPSITTGLAAPVGSIATLDDDVNARIWIKSGVANTAWSIIPRLASGTALQSGAVLFADANGFITGNTAKIRWDDVNNRMGIGANAPAVPQSTIHIDRGNATGGHIRFTAGTTTGQSTGDGFEIGIDNAGNAELIQFENSPMNFLVNGSRYLQLTPTGRLLLGTNANAIDITGLGTIPAFQIAGTDAFATQMAAITYSADANPSVFNLLKSRGALNAQGLVQANDEIGRLTYRGSDGVNFQAAASIRALVDGTAASGSMPGRLAFFTTPAGSTVPTIALTINSSQMAIFNNAIRIGNTTDATGGNIRYVSDSDMQGYVGGAWRSLINQPTFTSGSAATTTTTSTTDVLMDSMTITPGAGTYFVEAGTTIQSSTSNALITITLYANGVAQPNSARTGMPRVDASGGLGGNANTVVTTSISTSGIVTVGAGQAIELRWRTQAGTASAFPRSITLIRTNI